MLAGDQQQWVTVPPEDWGAAEGAQSPTAGLCRLCSEATWRRGDRPADSWGTGSGTRGQSKDGRPSSCLWTISQGWWMTTSTVNTTRSPFVWLCERSDIRMRLSDTPAFQCIMWLGTPSFEWKRLLLKTVWALLQSWLQAATLGKDGTKSTSMEASKHKTSDWHEWLKLSSTYCQEERRVGLVVIWHLSQN